MRAVMYWSPWDDFQDALQFLSRSKATLPGGVEYDIGALALLGVVHARLDQREEGGTGPRHGLIAGS